MKPEFLRSMPDWPARMTADVAALYMGISKGSFLTRFAPHGVKEGANTLWSRLQLDHLVARQFNLTQAPGAASGDDSWDDLD